MKVFVGLLVMSALIAITIAWEADTDDFDMIHCVCPRNLDPVCGTNGKNYANPCMFSCERDYRMARGRSDIRIAKIGNCDDYMYG